MQDGIIAGKKRAAVASDITDQVFMYASKVMSLGLFYMEYSDAIHEGDGFRVLTCWRYLLLLFKANQRKNYAIEALNLLAQYHYFFSQRQAEQLLWSRFVNVHGLPGKNIPSDLFMEHLNKVCKLCINDLGPNKTKDGLKRVGKCIGPLNDLLTNYDIAIGITEASGRHKLANVEKDKAIIMDELCEAKVFCNIPERKHEKFQKIGDNIVMNKNNLIKWMKQQIHILKYGI